LLARCYFELKDYKKSAAAWDKAFEMNGENGVYAANAANAFDLAGKKEEALTRFITAGKIFLNQDNQAELGTIIPKLSILGGNNWEARILVGKWAFTIEDYNRCITEFSTANKLRCAISHLTAAPALLPPAECLRRRLRRGYGLSLSAGSLPELRG
jgi:hypothetical protein